MLLDILGLVEHRNLGGMSGVYLLGKISIRIYYRLRYSLS